MSASPNNSHVHTYQRWSRVAGVFTLLVGGLVLVGWFTGNDALKTLLPGSIRMKANTALAFMLAGMALWLLHAKLADRRMVMLRRACSALVLLVGLLTLSEYVLGWNLGIDQLLVRETLEYGGVFPGRMAPLTALNFVLLGVSLLHLDGYRRVRAAQIIALPAIVLSLQAVVGYLYGVPLLYRVGELTPIALPTAITFVILGLGMLWVRPEQGWMAVMASDSPAGVMARRLLPAAVLLPIVLGWLHLLTESANLYEEVFVEALAAVVHVVIYSALVVWSVLRLHRMDLAREQAEAEVRRLNTELEERVVRRTAQLATANELVEQERDQLQTLMDNIPDTIYFKDTASRFVRVNRAQARTLGVEDPQQAVGKADAYYFAPEAAAAAQADEQLLIRTGESIIDRREMNPTPEGKPRWFSSTKVPILDQHGKVTGLVGISRDITNHVLNEKAAERANARLSSQVNQMSMIIELNEELHACAVDQEVYQVTARLVSRLFPGEQGALYAIDPVTGSVETAVAWGTPALPAQSFEVDDCWALRRGRPHFSGGDRTSEVCPHLADTPSAYSVCLPLAAAGERLGILHLRTAPSSEMRDSTDVQKQSAQLAADSLALAWANVRLRDSLREQSVRDPLTGLYNRRHMQASLERELRRAARNSKPIGIMMLDIDHFKEVNDTHGHDAGDVVLRELGRFLNEHTRGGDVACRLGGEEFIIILPEASLEQTAGRAEKHRQGFSAMRIECNGKRIDTPSLSIGVAAYPQHGTTAEELLREADTALYLAKEAGRNRVITAK